MRALRTQFDHAGQAREVVGRYRQREKLINLIQSAHNHLAHVAKHSASAEALLYALAGRAQRVGGRHEVLQTLREEPRFVVGVGSLHLRLAPV